MSLAAGSVLGGHYRVLRRLGEGGMGSVYLVEDLGRPGAVWALKELVVDPNDTPEDQAWARRRFEDEIVLMGALRHPRIPAFVQAVSDGGHRAFVMEYIPGATLQEKLDMARGPLPEGEVLAWASAVCEMLSYLHERKPPIIVRDLKPANVMVTPAGEVKLIDLGIARTYKPGKISNTENLGTMTYASPEHLGHAQTDARSDIYSLGATLYHLLTGREPQPMETPAPGSLRRFAPTLSETAEAIVIRAMRLDPAQRFQAARDMRDAIERGRANQAPAVSHAPLATLPIPAVRAAPPPAPATAAPGTQMSLVCPRCGHINRATAKFCARDGAPLRAASQTTANSSTSPGPGLPPRTTTGGRATTADFSAQRASEAFNAGRFAQAARQCESAIAQGRVTPDVYLLLGRAQRALGVHTAAAEAFARAAELHPTPQALLLEAEERMATGAPEVALLALTRARQLDPRNPEILLRLGSVGLTLGHLSQAEGDLREALALRPDAPDVLVALGRAEAARGERVAAVGHLRHAVAVAPRDVAAHVELGRVLIALGERAEARKALEQAARLAPSSEAHDLLAGLRASPTPRARWGRTSRPDRRAPSDDAAARPL